MPTEQEQQAANAAESQNELSITEYRDIREGRKTPAPEPQPTKKTDPPADATPPATEHAGDDDAPDDLEEPSSDSNKEKTNRKRERINARFSELTQEIRGLKAQLSADGSNRTAGQPETTPPKAVAAAPPPAVVDPSDLEPKADDFTDYIEWQKNWTRWDRRQAAREESAKATRDRAVEEQRTQAQNWQGKVTEAHTKYADFAAVAQNPDLPVSQAMAQAITDTDLGTEILYFLGKNPAEAARIAKLAPVAQVRAIGVLEAKLTPAEPESEPEPPPHPKPVSQAPKPVRPLAGAAAVGATVRNFEGMSQAEYRAQRESGRIR